MSRQRGPRRRSAWADTVVNSTLVSGGAGVGIRLSNVLFPDETTLVRTILCLSIQPSTPVADSVDLQLTFLGLGVTSEEAFGVDALPQPDDIIDFPILGWVYRCGWNVLECAGLNIPVIRVDQEIRAQRKLGRGTSYAIFKNEPGAGTPFTVRFFGTIRQMFLLP